MDAFLAIVLAILPTVAIILLGLLVVGYFVYASIVRKHNAVEESYSGIDVQLTKRHDLIPNIIATAKKFMKHEKELLENIVALRNSAMKYAHGKDVKKAIETENQLESKLGQLNVAVEAYPTLKSDATMVEVQEALADVEEHIAAARRFYNSNVRVLNDTIKVWPMSMVANWMKLSSYPYFEAAKGAEKNIDAEKMFE